LIETGKMSTMISTTNGHEIEFPMLDGEPVYEQVYNLRADQIRSGFYKRSELSDVQMGLVYLDKCHHVSTSSNSTMKNEISYRVRICKTCCRENGHIELGTFVDQESAILINEAHEILHKRFDKLCLLRKEDEAYLPQLTARKYDRSRGREGTPLMELLSEKSVQVDDYKRRKRGLSIDLLIEASYLNGGSEYEDGESRGGSFDDTDCTPRYSDEMVRPPSSGSNMLVSPTATAGTAASSAHWNSGSGAAPAGGQPTPRSGSAPPTVPTRPPTADPNTSLLNEFDDVVGGSDADNTTCATTITSGTDVSVVPESNISSIAEAAATLLAASEGSFDIGRTKPEHVTFMGTPEKIITPMDYRPLNIPLSPQFSPGYNGARAAPWDEQNNRVRRTRGATFSYSPYVHSNASEPQDVSIPPSEMSRIRTLTWLAGAGEDEVAAAQLLADLSQHVRAYRSLIICM
jgi:hypothetical protein